MAYSFLTSVLAAAVILTFFSCGSARGDQAAVERGRYLSIAGGCSACHSSSSEPEGPLAGGPPLVTPFGTFYAPNITPDPDHGIGRWSDQDFLRAMREGVSPQGQHYYPAFPYTSYTKALDRDLLDLKAYLFVQPAVAEPDRSHAVRFPYSIRSLLGIWKFLNFDATRWTPDAARSDAWNRGSYLIESLSHCGECHTPRGFLGGLDREQWMAGARIGDGTTVAPNLTPHDTGLAGWSKSDVILALDFGMTPDFEPFGGEMGIVVHNITSRLTKADKEAIVIYLEALPPLPSAVENAVLQDPYEDMVLF